MFHHEVAPGANGGEPTTRSLSDRRPSSTGAWENSVARLVERFADEWRRGERPRAERFLALHPLIADRPEAAIRIIYEEVFLRRGEGEEVTLAELASRFPRWRNELAVLLDCDRLLEGPAPPTFPETGETLGDYVLLRELGRGARGRCFLAAQPTLSDRRVALKVAPDDHAEHLSLARLQHTHIMPLYSEHEFPERRLRALCMPYLGGGSLARILCELARVPAERRTGQSLLEAIDAIGNDATDSVRAVDGPARRFLSRSSYVQAACWIGACLADALSYAHDRGLVHLDIKPSNVLLAADGQPMLLDFHLARAPFSGDHPPPDGVGGTTGYMSPEQEALVRAMDAGRGAPFGLDARSDIYSLGRVLAEMLAADAGDFQKEGAMSGHGRRAPRYLPGVSTGLADIIGRCLAIDPADRYPDAAALAEDLRRHMADRPLAGVPNRSLRERWAKWVRRQPHGFLLLRIALLGIGAAAAIASVVWFGFLAPRFRGASDSLAEGRAMLERRSYADAARILTRGAALIEGLPGGGALEAQLGEALRLTARLDEADRLHGLVDRLRLAESAADRAGPSAREVEEDCLALWARRHSLLDRRGLPADPRLDEQLRRDLLDVAVIGSYLRVRRQTGRQAIAEAHRAGLNLLDEAEALLGPSHVVYLARREHAAALGLSQMAETAAHHAEALPPRTAWDHDAAGRILMAAGDLAGAQAQFERALELRPQDVWPNFHQGVCAFRRGRYDEALVAFRVCVALAPDRAECYYNRALALAALGRDAEAARDLARAEKLDPGLELQRARHPHAHLKSTTPNR